MICLQLPEKLWPVFEGPARYRGAYGGRGSAKSWGFARMLLARAYEQRRRILCARELQNSIKDSVHKLLSDQITSLGFPGFDVGESYIRHANGSEFIFKGLRTNASEIKSMEGIDIAWVEEAQKVSQESWEVLIPTIRSQDSEIWVTFNPGMETDPTSQRFIENKPPNSKIARINYVDNPWFPAELQQEMEYLKSIDEESYKHVWLGQYRDPNKGGAVVQGWSFANVTDTPFRPELTVYLSCDFNIDPNCWVMAHRFNNEYHFFDELCLENTTTLQAAEEFYRRYKDHMQDMRIIVTGDASGKNRSTQAQDALTSNYTIIRNTLSSLGVRDIQINLNSRNPSPDTRVMAFNAAVCNSAGIRRISVNPKCKWLIWNCETLHYIPGTSIIWEPTTKQIEDNPKLKYTKHIFDAASYLVERYDPIKLDKPVDRPQHRIVAAKVKAR